MVTSVIGILSLPFFYFIFLIFIYFNNNNNNKLNTSKKWQKKNTHTHTHTQREESSRLKANNEVNTSRLFFLFSLLALSLKGHSQNKTKKRFREDIYI